VRLGHQLAQVAQLRLQRIVVATASTTMQKMASLVNSKELEQQPSSSGDIDNNTVENRWQTSGEAQSMIRMQVAQLRLQRVVVAAASTTMQQMAP
jgi:heterodisulfide reductase subunit A-like polyferredoxin